MLYSFLSLDLIMLILELHHFISSNGGHRSRMLPDVTYCYQVLCLHWEPRCFTCENYQGKLL